MTKEQAIQFANCLKNNYTIDFNDMADFCDMAIRAPEQQPCEDCARVLNMVMEYTYGMLTAEKVGLQHFIKSILDDLPPVTPTHKVGKWIEVWEGRRDEYTGEYDEWREYKCSVCGFQEFDADRFKYCPNCSAEMRGSEKE